MSALSTSADLDYPGRMGRADAPRYMNKLTDPPCLIPLSVHSMSNHCETPPCLYNQDFLYLPIALGLRLFVGVFLIANIENNFLKTQVFIAFFAIYFLYAI